MDVFGYGGVVLRGGWCGAQALSGTFALCRNRIYLHPSEPPSPLTTHPAMAATSLGMPARSLAWLTSRTVTVSHPRQNAKRTTRARRAPVRSFVRSLVRSVCRSVASKRALQHITGAPHFPGPHISLLKSAPKLRTPKNRVKPGERHLLAKLVRNCIFSIGKSSCNRTTRRITVRTAERSLCSDMNRTRTSGHSFCVLKLVENIAYRNSPGIRSACVRAVDDDASDSDNKHPRHRHRHRQQPPGGVHFVYAMARRLCVCVCVCV